MSKSCINYIPIAFSNRKRKWQLIGFDHPTVFHHLIILKKYSSFLKYNRLSIFENLSKSVETLKCEWHWVQNHVSSIPFPVAILGISLDSRELFRWPSQILNEVYPSKCHLEIYFPHVFILQ